MLSDLRFAARQLAKTPGFTFVALVTLALGIGVNAAMFSFVRDMLLRPASQHARQNLVAVYTKISGPAQDFRRFTHAEFTALRQSPDIFRDVTAYGFDFAAVGQHENFKRSFVGFVPENYFSIFRVQPHAGRFFTADEAQPNAAIRTAVANHTFWQRMGGRADFLGSEIQINRQTFTIVGIAPQGFGGHHASIGPDLWLPLGVHHLIDGADLLHPKTASLYLIASLPPGVSLEAARAQTAALDRRLNELNAGDEPRQLVLTEPPLYSLSAHRPEEQDFLPLFAGLTLALSAVVLLVACLNLANMLLARGTARRKEIAIRLSLGASRSRVVRQLLAEGLLLSLVGGTGGVLLSLWCGDLALHYAAETFAAGPFAMTMHPAIDASLVVVAIGLSMAAMLAFSLLPALRSTRVDLVTDLKQQPGDSPGTDRWSRFFSMRHCMVMAQIALSLALLFSAGLFVRGLFAARDRDPGFDPERHVGGIL